MANLSHLKIMKCISIPTRGKDKMLGQKKLLHLLLDILMIWHGSSIIEQI